MDAVMYSKRTGRVRCVYRPQSIDPNPNPSEAELQAIMRANMPSGADVLVAEKGRLANHQLSATLASGKRPRELDPTIAATLDAHPIARHALVVEDRYCACTVDGTVLSVHHADPFCGDRPKHVGAHHFVLHRYAHPGDVVRKDLTLVLTSPMRRKAA